MESSLPSAAGDDSSSRLLDVRHRTMQDAMRNSGTYTGQIDVETDLPDGHGEMVYDKAPDDGSLDQPNNTPTSTNHPSLVETYKGSWRGGHWHGQGAQKLFNGDVFVGDFDRSVRTFGEYRWKEEEQQGAPPSAKHHQQPTYVLRKQRTYQGSFHENGRPHGHGKYTWSTTKVLSSSSSPNNPSVSTYVGMFDNGQRHGHGVYTSSVLQYTGEWEQGKYHGYGVLKVRNTTYRGQFHYGKKEGKGQEVRNDDGAVVHEGMWKQDRPVMVVVEETLLANELEQQQSARPVSTLFQTPQEIVDGEGIHGMYKGIVEASLPSGVGTITYDGHPNAIVEYEGFFDQQGRRHGYGRATFQNGDHYQGNWNDGVFEGSGEYTFRDGRLYKGEWWSGLPHGTDEKFMWPNNDLFQGVYDNGRRKKGRLVFADGGYYDGEFFTPDGDYGGSGKLVTLLITFEGGFRDGAFHGQGCLRNSSGVVIFDGEWKDGQPARDEILGAIPEAYLDIPHPPQDDDFGAFEDSQAPETSGLLSTLQRTISPTPRAINGSTDRSTSGSDQNAQVSRRSSIFDSLETIALGLSSSVIPAKSSNKSTAPTKEDSKAVVDMAVSDAQDNPGRYTGIIHIESQRPHGVGRMVYLDGNRIHEGFWVHGHREGHGRCLFSQIGDYHEGEYKQNLRQGPGKYFWKDGRKFIGNYEQDERSGEGKFVYPNGDFYVGNFEKGSRSGFGVFTFSNRTCQYRGEWKKSTYDGLGRLLWKGEDGTHAYDGEFSGGLFHGEGVETVNQTVKHRGWWDNGSYRGESHPGEISKELANVGASLEDIESLPSTDECPTNLEQNYDDHRLQWKRNLEPTGV